MRSLSLSACCLTPNIGLPPSPLHAAWGHRATRISSELGSHTNTADSVLEEGRQQAGPCIRDKGQFNMACPPRKAQAGPEGLRPLMGSMGAPSERRAQPQLMVPTVCLPEFQPSSPQKPSIAFSLAYFSEEKSVWDGFIHTLGLP